MSMLKFSVLSFERYSRFPGNVFPYFLEKSLKIILSNILNSASVFKKEKENQKVAEKWGCFLVPEKIGDYG